MSLPVDCHSIDNSGRFGQAVYSEVSRSGWPMSGTWSRPDVVVVVVAAAAAEVVADTFAYVDNSPDTDCL